MNPVIRLRQAYSTCRTALLTGGRQTFIPFSVALNEGTDVASRRDPQSRGGFLCG